MSLQIAPKVVTTLASVSSAFGTPSLLSNLITSFAVGAYLRGLQIKLRAKPKAAKNIEELLRIAPEIEDTGAVTGIFLAGRAVGLNKANALLDKTNASRAGR